MPNRIAATPRTTSIHQRGSRAVRPGSSEFMAAPLSGPC
jgi:hypothetical protein